MTVPCRVTTPAVKACLLLVVLAFSLGGCVFLDLNRPPIAAPTTPQATTGPQAVLRCTEYQVVATDSQPVTTDILEQTRGIIEARVNATGVAEFVVQAQGADRILVKLPSTANVDEIQRLIGTTGRLDFVAVPPAFNSQVVDGQPLPPNMDPTPIFSGDQISVARPGTDNVGKPAVDIELKEEGARLFDDFAAAHYQERFAIVLDGKVISAPSINATHFNGRAQISGSFTVEEMNLLVTVLKFGSLPLPIQEVGFMPCE